MKWDGYYLHHCLDNKRSRLYVVAAAVATIIATAVVRSCRTLSIPVRSHPISLPPSPLSAFSRASRLSVLVRLPVLSVLRALRLPNAVSESRATRRRIRRSPETLVHYRRPPPETSCCPVRYPVTHATENFIPPRLVRFYWSRAHRKANYAIATFTYIRMLTRFVRRELNGTDEFETRRKLFKMSRLLGNGYNSISGLKFTKVSFSFIKNFEIKLI